MRRLTIVALLFALTAGSGCLSSGPGPSPVASGSGTIRYSSLEGGFYLIVSDDGRRFDPTNLDPAFRHDGLRVRFLVRPRPDGVSAHMVGAIVDVIRIEPLDGP